MSDNLLITPTGQSMMRFVLMSLDAAENYHAHANELMDGNDKGKWYEGLNTRIRNAVLTAGYNDKERLLSDVKSGHLKPMSIPNLGRQGFNKLCLWLDFSPEALKQFSIGKQAQKEFIENDDLEISFEKLFKRGAKDYAVHRLAEFLGGLTEEQTQSFLKQLKQFE